MGDGKKGKNKKKNSVPATQGNKVETNGTTPLQEQLKKTEQPEVQATPKPAEPKEESKRAQEKTSEKPVRKEKKNKKKSSREPGLIARLYAFLTLKRVIFTYILYVVFICGNKSDKPRSPFNELVCSNGISQYILEHGLFQKYIEPSVILLKTDYVEPSVKFLNEKYEIHAKPIIDPLAEKAAAQYEINAKSYVESAHPYYETAKEYYYEYVHTPSIIIWRDTKIWYKENAKKHVDKVYAQSQEHYGKAKVFLHPYWAEAQIQAAKAYEHNKKLYHQHVAPVVEGSRDTITVFYYKRVEPMAQKTLVILNDIYIQQIIPAYQYLESQVTKAIEFIRAQLRDEKLEERKKKAKEEAERKAKKAEAERKRKAEAERKAKAEAERKAKEQAERKAKAEAERKAKAEAEKKAREEAEKKEAERKAELAAIEAATFAVNNAAKEKIENLSNSISVTVEKFKKKIDGIKKDKLDHILNKVDGFQNSANQQLGELNKFAEQVKLDSKLNVTDKKNNITTATKKVLEDVREKSKKILKDVEDLSEKITTEIKTHKQEIELVLTEQVDNTKSHLRKTIDKNVKADKSRLEDFEKRVDEVSKQAIADFTLVEIAAEEEIKRTSNKTISLVIQTSKDAAQSIYKARNAATDAFEKQHLELARSSNTEQEKAKASEEGASTPDKESTRQKMDDEPVIVKTSDPVLEKLRTGIRQKQDPVLAKLKANYMKMVEEKSEGNTDPPLDELDECEVQSQCGG